MKEKTATALFAVIFSVLFLTALPVHAGEINLSAAASTKDAMQEIIEGFKKVQPDARVLTNFGASGTLAKQAVLGAPTDVYVSANTKWLDYVVQEGMAAKNNKKIMAYNKLVFVGRKGLPVTSIEGVKTLERIAIGSPASVPAGQYAEQAMRAAGVYDLLEKENKLVMAKDVRQALLYADRNEVDGAFVYQTDAMLARDARILFVVPDDLYDRVSYPMVITAAGEAKPEARSFFAYLSSPEAQAILQKFGFVAAD